jgi:hypothetical protein
MGGASTKGGMVEFSHASSVHEHLYPEHKHNGCILKARVTSSDVCAAELPQLKSSRKNYSLNLWNCHVK